MKIERALLVGPERNFWYGSFAVAVSIFIFAYSSRLGPASILFYYALWLPLILVDPRRVLGNPAAFYWIWGFALFACLSVFWSTAPSVSARGSVQLMSTIICALIAARTVASRTLTLGGLAGTAAVVAYSLTFGEYSYDPLDGSYTFAGAFASKNQLGLFSSLWIYFAVAAVFMLRERFVWKALAIVCGAMSAYALAASQSATSMIATAATLAAIVAVGLILPFSPRLRKTGVLVGAVVAVCALLVGANLGVFDLVLGAFGKDATLTGRTYLWSEGLAAGLGAPIFGVGFQAYWVQGFSEAERLWAEFYITARGGFHFHNTFIEVFVELGTVGLLLIAHILVRVPGAHLLRLLDDRGDRSSYVLFGLGVMLLVRSLVEVDVIQAYSVGTFLLTYAAGVSAGPRPVRLFAAVPTQPPASQMGLAT